MTSTTTTPQTGPSGHPTDRHLPRHLLTLLQDRVGGRVRTPADDDWAEVAVPWRVNIVQRPLAVLEARDAHDVVAALKWAVDHDVPVTTQTTGHGATGSAGSSAVDGTLVVRCSGLRDLEVDLGRRTAWVGAGVRAGELLSALDGTGLTFLCGSNPSPTVVGMTVTGGLSWFGRAYGSGADSVRRVELVDGLGRLRVLDAGDGERFWAVRGAGGDFGVVTRIEIDLHPAPVLSGGRMVWPVARLADVLSAFRTVTHAAPPELSAWLQVQHMPDAPFLPPEVRGQSFAAVAFTFLGGADDARRHLAPLAGVPGMLMDTSDAIPLAELGAVAAEPVDPTPSMEHARLLTRLDDETAAALVAEIGSRDSTSITIVQLRHLGGALREPGTSAFGPIEEEYLLQAIGIPADEEVAAAVMASITRLDSAVAAVSTGRAPLAFLAEDDTDRWWTSDVRSRLVASKRDLDPLGIVRSNRPVTR